MKSGTVFLLCALLACSPRASAEQEFDGSQAMSYVETQMEFGPRVPNTEGHRRTGDWILGRLRSTADSTWEQPFLHVTANGDTLRLRNIGGRFRPEMTDRILYVTHWDTRPFADRSANLGEQRLPVPGANDARSALSHFCCRFMVASLHHDLAAWLQMTKCVPPKSHAQWVGPQKSLK